MPGLPGLPRRHSIGEFRGLINAQTGATTRESRRKLKALPRARPNGRQVLHEPTFFHVCVFQGSHALLSVTSPSHRPRAGSTQPLAASLHRVRHLASRSQRAFGVGAPWARQHGRVTAAGHSPVPPRPEEHAELGGAPGGVLRRGERAVGVQGRQAVQKRWLQGAPGPRGKGPWRWRRAPAAAGLRFPACSFTEPPCPALPPCCSKRSCGRSLTS